MNNKKRRSIIFKGCKKITPQPSILNKKRNTKKVKGVNLELPSFVKNELKGYKKDEI